MQYAVKYESHLPASSIKMVRLAWQAQPLILVGIVLVEILNGLIPLTTAWLTKLLFDLLAQELLSVMEGSVPQKLVFVLTVQVLLSIFGYVLGLVNSYFKSEMGRRLMIHVQTKIYGKINSLTSVKYFEDPQFYNSIELASQGAQRGPIQTLHNINAILRNLVTLLSFFGVLLIFNPFLMIAVTECVKHFETPKSGI